VPRSRNAVDTVKLQLSTTPQVVAALEALVTSGKFGKNASEAGEELLRLKLREVELEGWLRPTGRPQRR
jgi:Arc/MetJ-type ribon-helix-helix transcriptional regulator